MAGELVVGNGNILINLDPHLQIRDIYFPYVGYQNHVQGYPNRLGVWVNGSFSWLSSNEWEIDARYHKDSLITFSKAKNANLGISLLVEDGVHQRENIFLRKISVTNHSDEKKDVRLFFHQDLSIYETEIGDTAFYDPETDTIIHYKKNRYFLFNGEFEHTGIQQYTTGIKRFQLAEGTWRDAEDGLLHTNPIAQGSVDSTFSLEQSIGPHETKIAYYWLTLGKKREEAVSLNYYLKEIGPSLTLDKITVYWRKWIQKANSIKADLSEDIIDLYKRSLLIVRTQTNQNGFIMAANDSRIQHYNRDHYSYMWPRDGALVAAAMTKAGYHRMVENFYRRCAELITEDGYLHHKYNPDGSIGSSWHPLVGKDGEVQLPIQEDETALVLWALWQDYTHTEDIEFAQSLYRSFVRPAARFLLDYFDDHFELPKPSYDLWEERRGIFAFTASSVYGGLMAAYSFAELFGEQERALKYKQGAERIKQGISTHLYDSEIGRFIRGIYVDSSGNVTKDLTIESSLYGLFAFGVFKPDDERMIATMNAIENELSIQTEIGGIARYYNDYYFQQTHHIEIVPGNPWIICTLWLAKWKIAKAKKLSDLKEALAVFHWVVKHASPSGLLPEQLHPMTGEPLSVSPLTWSHATFVDVIVDYVTAFERISQNTT
ncbi:glycoside hydrolase family 15 protein [Fictibacillus gelatini]|uniref:glycoside hydrolase family 15 protein n=1 Tax=Fictibacillus gelatini TaxID=225985 RepID=UPI00041DD389|nr:glycoside hydrolase family 15 protein [Fictibacillus gelatini]